MFDRKFFFRLLWPVLIDRHWQYIGMVNTMMVSGVGMTAISAVAFGVVELLS